MRFRNLLPVLLLLLAGLLPGCVRSPQAPVRAERPQAPRIVGVSQYEEVRLDGLVVSLETTLATPHDGKWLAERGVSPLPVVVGGKRVLWVLLDVWNSTDSTIAAATKSNPSLLDAQGRSIRLLFPRSFRGSDGHELPPRHLATKVVPFEIASRTQTYTITWDLGDSRKARWVFASP